MAATEKQQALAEIISRTDDLLAQAKSSLAAGDELFRAYGLKNDAGLKNQRLSAAEKNMLSVEMKKYFPGLQWDDEWISIGENPVEQAAVRPNFNKRYI